MAATKTQPNKNLAWNLADLYQSPDDPRITTDWQTAEQLVQELMAYRDKIKTLAPDQLLALIRTWEKLSMILERLNIYASLLESTQIGIPPVTRFSKQIEERTIQLSTQIIFIETELAQLPEETWQTFLTAATLKAYYKFLTVLHEQAKHTLSEPEERILAEKSQTSWQALSHLFSITTDTLSFDWEGNSITLEELLAKFHDADPTIRAQTAQTLHNGLAANNKTTPAILNSLIQDKAISDRLRHFDYPEQARFLSDDVERPTVEAMVSAVNASHGLVTRYYELKKKLMGAKQLYWWDRYAPLPAAQAKISIESAQVMVLDALTEFSPEVAALAQKMIDRSHIDWLPSPTKRGGAFCAYGEKGGMPYVLLNYTEQPRDVMTLAHELGHAIHDMLADEPNVFFEKNASLALAEIASVFGETLLFEKMVNSTLISKEDKISLLMSFIEDRFSTSFRQAAMFQFEQQLHRKRRSEGELSREEIDQLWDETMKKPFAGALTYTPEHQNTWMYVGHIFQMPFYVYSYSFAQLCVLALYQQYKAQGQQFVPTYLKLLKAGGTLSPKKNLAQAGLDINQPSFWQGGLTVIEHFIDELERLVN